MSARKITKVEISPLFWKDLAEWRTHRDYRLIRRHIAEMVGRLSRGESGGDLPMKNKVVWGGIRHMHVPASLVVFTSYPDPDTVRICALKKHDWYGYGSQRTNIEATAGKKLRNAAEKPAVRSPEWSSLKWADPSEIAGHPELSEMARDGLDRLYREIMDEMDTFSRLGARIETCHRKEAALISDRWLEDLVSAQEAVECAILTLASMRRDHLTVEEVRDWVPEP